MEAETTRRFIIGDVHGCTEELLSLLELLEERYGEDGNHFLFVGDLVDRGPDSAGSVQLVMEGVRKGTFRCILGNHDEMLLQNLLLYRPDLVEAAGIDPTEQESLVRSYRAIPERVFKLWLSQGGSETILSYGGKPKQPKTWFIPADHIRFLATLPLAIRDGEVVVTHAWAEAEAVERALAHHADPWNITAESRMSLLWNRDRPARAPAGLHVSGHTARREPLVTGGAIGIDTGCCFGNRLTAYNPEENLFLQVSCPEF